MSTSSSSSSSSPDVHSLFLQARSLGRAASSVTGAPPSSTSSTVSPIPCSVTSSSSSSSSSAVSPHAAVSPADAFSSFVTPGAGFMSDDEFRKEAHSLIDFLIDYRKRGGLSSEYPVRSSVAPNYLFDHVPSSMPTQAEPFSAIFADIEKHILPGLTHWSSPNFYAYFRNRASNASILGEILINAFNVVGFSWVGSPALTELEMIVMDWWAKAMGLDERFFNKPSKQTLDKRGGLLGGGVIHGAATEASIVTVLAAKSKILDGLSPEIAALESCRLVAYVSDQGHPVTAKACKVAGVPQSRLRILKTSPADAHALRGATLEAAVRADVAAGLLPFYVCATVGTTTSGITDRVEELSAVLQKYAPRAWLHGDAAWAGVYALCPEWRNATTDFAPLLDSYSTNAHKQLLTNFDLTGTWVSERRWILSALSFMDAEYLRNAATDAKAVVDYKDWQLLFGRRFRALKLWLVFRSHGVEGLQTHLRYGVHLADRFTSHVKSAHSNGYRFVTQNFSLVLFRITHSNPEIAKKWDTIEGKDEWNKFQMKIVEEINSEGKLFLVHSTLDGKVVLRLAIGGADQREADIDFAWQVIQKNAEKVRHSVKL